MMTMRAERFRWAAGVVLLALGAYFLGRNLGWLPDLGNFGWTVVFAAGAVVCIGFWLSDRRQWWWLIPALNLAGIGAAIGLGAAGVEGPVIGSVFLWAIAAAFLLVWLARRDQWWALIPGGIMAVIGAMPLLAERVSGEWVGAFFLLAVGLAFLIVFLARPAQWWALIPAGVLTTLSLMPVIGSRLQGTVVGAIFFTGLGLTFLILWLLRGRYPTGWGIYPAVPLLAIALVTAAAPNLGEWWPVIAFIVPGLWLLLRAARGKA